MIGIRFSRNAAALADENLRNRAAVAGIKPLVGNRLLDSLRKAFEGQSESS